MLAQEHMGISWLWINLGWKLEEVFQSWDQWSCGTGWVTGEWGKRETIYSTEKAN